MPNEATETPEMKVDLLALRKLGSKIKADLDAELDRLDNLGETEMSPLAQERLKELAAVAALVQATS